MPIQKKKKGWKLIEGTAYLDDSTSGNTTAPSSTCKITQF